MAKAADPKLKHFSGLVATAKVALKKAEKDLKDYKKEKAKEVKAAKKAKS